MRRREEHEPYEDDEREDNPFRSPSNANFYTAFTQKRLKVTCGNMSKHVPFIIWDSIPACDASRCACADQCPYPHDGDGRKCTVQVKYIKRVYSHLISHLVEDTDDTRMMEIGLMLMPLYGQLIKFKLVEAGLLHGILESSRGGTKVHPVFKEIRSIMREIRELQKDIIRQPIAVEPGGVSLDELQNGDAEWHEALISATKSKKDTELRRQFGLARRANGSK